MTASKTLPSSVERRRFLQQTWHGVGASLALALVPGQELFTLRRFNESPFTLGVASGDPTPTGIVLWTRLAPDPADPGALGRASIPVGWRVASDSRMRFVVARGVAIAPAELAHSVHVEVDGLLPGRDYFYQFDVRAEESPIGHFRTAPAEHELARELRFAFATCQDWPSGYYTAYRDMLRNDLDLVLHLGDYTYEYAIGAVTGRGIPAARRLRGSVSGPADLPAAAHPAQARRRPAGGPREISLRRDLGRPRGGQRLLRAGAGVRRAVAGVQRAPRRRLPGLLRAHAYSRGGSA